MATYPFSRAALALSFAASVAAQQHQETRDDPPSPARGALSAVEADYTFRGVFKSIQVNVRNSANVTGDAANEPTIAIDPTDPDRMVIGWRQFDDVASNFRKNGWAFTSDGGATWTFPGSIQTSFNSDPVLDVDAQGEFFYLSYPGGTTLKLFRSGNAGQTWGPALNTVGGDKAWMIVDRTTSNGAGNVYMVWQVIHGPATFIRSLDNGRTFSQAFTVPDVPTFGTMTIGSNGTVYCVGRTGGSSSIFVLARSSNAKQANQTPTFQSTRFSLGGRVAIGGTPNPGGLLGQVQVEVDPVRPGHVYVLASVIPNNGDPMDVHFVRSTDGGRSFSNPVAINTDGLGAWQWFGTLSVAPNGRIDVVWNDTRNRPDTTSALWYSHSMDGGLTFSPNQRVSRYFDSTVGHPNQNKIGDYYHMRSSVAAAHLAYSTTFNGEQDVYYLELGDCNRNGTHDAIDIAQGTSFDSNQNQIPDECEVCQTDLGNGSGRLDLSVCGDDLSRANSEATITVENGLPSATVFLALAPARAGTPLPIGGGALVPDLTTGFVFAGAQTDADGRLGIAVPGGSNRVASIFIQAAMLTGSADLILSNAVEIRVGR